MPNPYGITEVDIPGVMGAVDTYRDNRVRQMVLQRQQEAAEAEAERRHQFTTMLAPYMMGQRAAPGQTAGQAPEQPARDVTGIVAPPQAAPMAPMAPAASPAVNVPPVAGGAPAAPVAAAAPAQPGVAQTGILPREVAMQLIAIDPEQATQVFGAFNAMNDAQHEQSQRINTAIATEAQTMLGIPEAQRPAALAAASARLQAIGIPPQQLANVPLTNESLTGIINQVRDIEKIREEARPRLRDVGGQVVDERMLPQATPGNPVVFESEFINTPQGMYRRGDLSGGGAAQQAPVRVTSPEQARSLPPGTPIILPDGSPGVVPGGPTRAGSGTFR